MSSSSSYEDEGSESSSSPLPVAKRSATPPPQGPSRKMHPDANERGAAPAATGHKEPAKRSPQVKQQQPAESGRQVQGDKPTPGKEAHQRQKERSAQEAALEKKTRKRERPESPPRGHVAKGEVLQDFRNVVKRFARGWMEEKQYTLLSSAANDLEITVPRNVREDYDSFRKNLLMESDREGDYNRNVSRALGEMRGIRRHIARADESLANDQTEECLTAWAEEHYFTRAEHRKTAEQRQKILSDGFVRELGCKYRMRVVIQRGLQDFHGLTKDTDMLHAFLKYVIKVERQAEKLRKPAPESQREKDKPSSASAAPEHVLHGWQSAISLRRCAFHPKDSCVPVNACIHTGGVILDGVSGLQAAHSSETARFLLHLLVYSPRPKPGLEPRSAHARTHRHIRTHI